MLPTQSRMDFRQDDNRQSNKSFFSPDRHFGLAIAAPENKKTPIASLYRVNLDIKISQAIHNSYPVTADRQL